MEREGQMTMAGGENGAGSVVGSGDSRETKGRPAPTWRALVISIIVAVVLSVTATLLLGGSFRLTGGTAVSRGCGPGSECCPPPEEGK
jgi:hypothetical protein